MIGISIKCKFFREFILLLVLWLVFSFQSVSMTYSWGLATSPLNVSFLGAEIYSRSGAENVETDNWEGVLKYSPQIGFFGGMNFGPVPYEESFGFDINVYGSYIEHYLEYFQNLSEGEDKLRAKKGFLSMESYALNANINFVYSFAHHKTGKFFLKLGPEVKYPLSGGLNLVVDEVSLTSEYRDLFGRVTPPARFGARFSVGASLVEDLLHFSFISTYWFTPSELSLSKELVEVINFDDANIPKSKIYDFDSIYLGDDLSLGILFAINLERLF